MNIPEDSAALPLILLTGGTGYIGGRLLEVLQSRNRSVRCLARRPAYLRARAGPGTEVVAGDCLNRSTLEAAMAGVDVGYYLVHSMASAGKFEEQDRVAARNFAVAARESGVRRIIYLGGLGEVQTSLSSHLRSRQEIGEILRDSGLQVIEFRASIVIGSGSLSYELIRALVERLPIMITPRWVSTPAQPIAIEDLLEYLVEALDLPGSESRVFEVGGKDQVSYADIMKEYARQRGLRRLMFPVPVLTPRLSSLWLGLVTTVYARVGRKLIEGLRNPTVVRDTSALMVFKVRPRSLRESIGRALRNEDQELASTRWSDALSSTTEPPSWGGVRLGSRIVDSREARVSLPPDSAFRPIRRIGGKNGWYAAHFLWRLRGFLDLLIGGVGLRRGRRDPENLAVGDVVDWWRVDAYEPNPRLRLLEEMKLPGRAWLEFEVEGNGSESVIRQTAVFYPLGLAGLLYWYLLYPLHRWVFKGMLRGIVQGCKTDPPNSEGVS